MGLSKRGYRLALLASYLTALAIVAALLLQRYWQEQSTPADQTSGGMWAFGDFLLTVFCLGILALTPTFQLLRAWSRREASYRRFLVGMAIFAATAPPGWVLVYAFPQPRHLWQLAVLLRVSLLAAAVLGISLINLMLVFRSPLRKWPLFAGALEGLPLLFFLLRLFVLAVR